MANPLTLNIQEPLPELKKPLRKQPKHLKGRVQMLILIKTGKALTKQALGEALSFRLLPLRGGVNCMLIKI
jgi:hypothetical protein